MSQRTPQQNEILAKAREKAKLVRAENAKLKQQEKELVKAEKEAKKKDIQERYKKLKGVPEVVDDEDEVEVPVRRTDPKPKVKKTKKKIVEISDSEEEEEEEEIIYVKKQKKKPPVKKKVIYQEEPEIPAHIPIDPRQERFDRMYNNLFTLR